LDALLVLALVTFVGAWFWTRADRRKRAHDAHRSP
jgi:hypothetical protein